MNSALLAILTIPFIGTATGAAMVFVMRRNLSSNIQKLLLGFASGVMVAASVWSLLIPAIDMNAADGKMAVIPAAVGFLCGIAFLLIMDTIIPHLHLNSDGPEGPKSHISKTAMLTLAVTLHNIPEGMAVGVAFAGAISGNVGMSVTGAIALATGIAIQNFPEGAIISMPLLNAGNSRRKSFAIGALSGIVEPIGAALTILLAEIVVPILPYLLAFAAGAMLYVVVEELIPEASSGSHSNLGTIGFASGFVLMMILDVVFG
mgnify:FL=1